MIAALFMAIAGSAPATPQTSSSHLWKVTPGHALEWEGRPYRPVGVRVPGTVEAIQGTHEAGITDIMIELPADGRGWSEALDAVRNTGQRYWIAVDSLAPMPESVTIEPDSYRIENARTGTVISTPMPGVTRVLIVLAGADGRRTHSEVVPTTGGRLEYKVTHPLGGTHVLLAYPVTRTGGQPDFYEGLDAHRDQMLLNLKQSDFGPGLRGWVNPLGRIPSTSAPKNGVPLSPLFRTEFAAYLRNKYGAVSTLVRSWGIGAANFRDINEAARLVPLWSNGKGLDAAWDPETNTVFNVNVRATTLWNDLREAQTIAGVRRTTRLTDALRKETGVPVMQEWDGWDGLAARPEAGLDGVGASLNAAREFEIINEMAGPLGTAFRRTAPTWMGVTDLRLSGELTVDDALDRVAQAGSQAVFVRSQDPEVWRRVASTEPLSTPLTAPQTLFFPLDARDPAQPMVLPGNVLWLPAPVAGDRLRMGGRYEGYTVQEQDGIATVLWSLAADTPVRIVHDQADALKFYTPDGTPIEVKKVRRGVEMVLPSLPIIVRGSNDPIIPADAFENAALKVNTLLGAVPTLADPDGREQVDVTAALSGWERNPGRASQAMWTILDRMLTRSAPYLWRSADSANAAQLAGLVTRTGSSSKQVLRMAPRFGGMAEAQFKVTTRIPGNHEVWVAASVPSGAVHRLAAQFGEIVLGPAETGISGYGQGFAWYKLGSVNLIEGDHQVKVQFSANPGEEVLLDTLVLAPMNFRPDGPRPPSDWMDGALKAPANR